MANTLRGAILDQIHCWHLAIPFVGQLFTMWILAPRGQRACVRCRAMTTSVEMLLLTAMNFANCPPTREHDAAAAVEFRRRALHRDAIGFDVDDRRRMQSTNDVTNQSAGRRGDDDARFIRSKIRRRAALMAFVRPLSCFVRRVPLRRVWRRYRYYPALTPEGGNGMPRPMRRSHVQASRYFQLKFLIYVPRRPAQVFGRSAAEQKAARLLAARISCRGLGRAVG